LLIEEMSQKIAEFFPWSFEANLSKEIVLCQDHSSICGHQHDGQFAFESLLLKLCRDSSAAVILIMCNLSAEHYRSLLRKNMLDIDALVQSKRLIMLSLVSNDEKEWNTPVSSSSTPSLSLDELKLYIDSIVSEPLVALNILVDDLDVFEMLSPSPQSARLFVQHITQQILSEINSLSSFIAFGRLTTASNDGESNSLSSLHCNGQTRLSEFLKYKCTVLVECSPLRSGFSTIVHGIIHVYQVKDLRWSQQSYQYKALDSGIVCAPSK